MRYPAKETAEKHERIVAEASRLFRERGFDGVTVAEVMQAAGLTHGAFYSHFDSKEDLMSAAVEHGMKTTLTGVKRDFGSAEGRAAYLNRYLSPAHRDAPGAGCTMAALSGEIRNEPEVKEAFTLKLKEIIAAAGGQRGAEIARLAAMVGALTLARAVSDEDFSLEILRETAGALAAPNLGT